jgi:hypothetical protein
MTERVPRSCNRRNNFPKYGTPMSLSNIIIRALAFLAIAIFSGASTATPPSAPAVEVREFEFDGSAAVAPAFSPDGKTVFFGRYAGETISIFVSNKVDGRWTAPKVASFSGTYRDLEPAFAPSGRYLIFASNRPFGSDGKLADGNYNGSLHPGAGGHLWRVELKGGVWREPVALPTLINSSDSTFSPSLAEDGSLYFMRPAITGEKFHLYRAQMHAGQYSIPERVSFSDLDGYGDFDPAIAKDERFMIFSSARPPAPPHQTDLFIVHRENDKWSDPVDLRLVLSDDVYGTEARLAPDEKTLFFTNARKLSSDYSADDKAVFVHTWEVRLRMSVLK